MRHAALLVLALLIFGALTLPAAADLRFATVTAERLNLRDAPGTHGAVLAELPRGTLLALRDARAAGEGAGDWIAVFAVLGGAVAEGGRVVPGYVSRAHVAFDPVAGAFPGRPSPSTRPSPPAAARPELPAPGISRRSTSLDIDVTGFRCDQSLVGSGGLRSCTTEISIRVDLAEPVDATVDVSCDIEIGFRRGGRSALPGEQTTSAYESTIVRVSRGSGRGWMTSHQSLPTLFGGTITSARLRDLSCRSRPL